MDRLPEECVSVILCFTSPADASRCSLLSSTIQSAADSDMVWHSFLPCDYHDIVSRAFIPLHFSSQKHLFYALSRPLLIDGGNKGVIRRMEQRPFVMELVPVPESRFAEVAVLRTVTWLEIEGKIRTGSLTPNTGHGVYMIMKVSERVYGLDSAPSKVSVQVGNRVTSGRAYLCHKDEKKQQMESLYYGNRREMLRKIRATEEEEEEEEMIGVPRKREDGWAEIEVGEFFSGEGDEEVKMSVMDVGYQLKGGLILEGIEVRPN